MDTNLQERRKQAEDNFNTLNEQKAQTEKQIEDLQLKGNELLTEMVKLQGEIRVLEELLATPATNVSEEANIIDVKEEPNAA